MGLSPFPQTVLKLLVVMTLLVSAAGCGQPQPAAPTATTGNDAKGAQVSNDQVPQRQDDAVVISLDQIWAANISGTHHLTTNRTNDTAEYVSPEGPLLQDICRHLALHKRGQNAAPALAVAGTGIVALRNAHLVLAQGQAPRESFPADTDVSVVFFSLEFGRDVQLRDVERNGQRVQVRYQFVPHMDAGVSASFALIPLGKLPHGRIEVEIIELPMDQRFHDLGVRPIPTELASQIVCRSFSFNVTSSE